MNLCQLLHSLSESERDYIACLDYGQDREVHRAGLEAVIHQSGDLDFDKQGYWHPYEVIELGKNCLRRGHEREFAACIGIVLHNIETGRDCSNDLDSIVKQHYDSIQQLPAELRELIDSLIEGIMSKSELDVSPNAGAVQRLHKSAAHGGPPSVS